jgi:ATP synthase protein I
MGGDPRDANDQGSRRTDDGLSARLKRLGERLDKSGIDRSQEPVASAPVDRTGLARGFRLSTEFVVGVLAGAVVGWAVDHWFKTSPGGLIVFTLLGFAAGVVNLVRTSTLASGDAINGGKQRRQD